MGGAVAGDDDEGEGEGDDGRRGGRGDEGWGGIEVEDVAGGRGGACGIA